MSGRRPREGEPRTRTREERIRVFALGGALGALASYFFDPESGKRRRHLALDRTAGFFRSSGRLHGPAAASRPTHTACRRKCSTAQEEPKDYDDATLADKIRSQVFRDPAVPKGTLNVNVQKGVVQLRGEVPPDLIDELVAETRKVRGVREVENLLHVPGTKAPMHD